MHTHVHVDAFERERERIVDESSSPTCPPLKQKKTMSECTNPMAQHFGLGLNIISPQLAPLN